LLSSVFVGGLPAKGTSKGEKVLVGGASGVLTLWERGQWDDQDERIIVDRSPGGGESLDVLAMVPDGIGAWGKVVAVGQGDGQIRFVRIGQNKVISELKHDALNATDAVVGLGFDVGGRMISGGGTTIKVWHEKSGHEDEEDDEAEPNGASKRGLSDDDDSDEEDEDEDSSDEERKRRKRKKRNKNEGSIGNHGIMAAFSGLD